MNKYVVVVLFGDYGDYAGTVAVEAESVEEAKKKAVASFNGFAGDHYADVVVKGEIVEGAGGA